MLLYLLMILQNIGMKKPRQHVNIIFTTCRILAGLGVIGRNNLLINELYGNMIQIGALLSETEIEPQELRI